MKQFRLIVLMSIAVLGMSSVYGSDSSLLMIDPPVIPFKASTFCEGIKIGLALPGVGIALCLYHDSNKIKNYYDQKYYPEVYIQKRLNLIWAMPDDNRTQCTSLYVKARQALAEGNTERSKEKIKQLNKIMPINIVDMHNFGVDYGSETISLAMGICVGSASSLGFLIACAASIAPKKQICECVCNDLD